MSLLCIHFIMTSGRTSGKLLGTSGNACFDTLDDLCTRFCVLFDLFVLLVLLVLFCCIFCFVVFVCLFCVCVFLFLFVVYMLLFVLCVFVLSFFFV